MFWNTYRILSYKGEIVMPKGVYKHSKHTKQHNRKISKSLNKWNKENPKKSHINAVKRGKIGGILGGKIMGGIAFKETWKNDREKMIKASSRGGKKGGKIGGKITGSKNLIKWIKEHPEEHRKNSLKMGAGSKIRWENDREKWLMNASLGGKNAWKNNYEKMKENCSKNIKNFWKIDYKGMLKHLSKIGKIGGKIGGKNLWKKYSREKMLEGCSRGGKASIQKQQKLYPSLLELIVRNYLDKIKVDHQDNVWFKYNGKRKEADIVVPKYNLIIECDGWGHKKLETKINDKYKTKLFNYLGYKVLRLKGPEIRNGLFVNKILMKVEVII